MADDFDVIYEVDGVEEDVGHVESPFAAYVPDPIVIKGAGNITVYAVLRCQLWLLEVLSLVFVSPLCTSLKISW